MANEKKPVASNEVSATKVITDVIRLSFVHVWQPTSMEAGKDPKYSVSAIIPKTNTDLINRINAAVKAATELGKDGKWGGKIPAKLKLPLRDGDTERPEDETYKGAYFLSCSSKTKPGVVGLDRQPIIDESQVYSGCYGRLSLNFYPFNSNGSKGVACGLNHVQKVKDGEALSGISKAEDDFADDVEEGEDLLGG